MVLLLVLVAVVFMILIDILFIHSRKRVETLSSATQVVFNKKSILAPEGFYLSKGHTWAKIIDKNKIRIGIDDFVTKALGQVSILNFVEPGTMVKKGDLLMLGKFDSKTVRFLSPVEGKIEIVNSKLIGNVISDPYNNDWGVEIKTDSESSLSLLKSGTEAINFMKDEFKRLKEFLVMNSYKPQLAGVTMYDGGNVIEGAIANLDKNTMLDFETMFLSF